MICRKCASGRIAGPRYTVQYGRESLRYRCLTCGYEWSACTVEQQQRASARETLKRIPVINDRVVTEAMAALEEEEQ